MTSPTQPIALLTGVGRPEGIGFEVARQFLARGFTVILTARRQEAASDLAGRLRAEVGDVHAFRFDVTSPGDATDVATRVGDRWGRLDILVNNAAGVSAFGEKPSTADLGAARQVMDATLFGAWRTCQAFLPLLRRSAAGRIVNVSSGAGSHDDAMFGLTSGNSMGPGYAVSKAALNALTAALATELHDSSILVNAVCPGFTATFPGGEAMGARPVSEGAKGVVWAATLPNDGPRGGFFRDGKPLPW